MGFVIFESSGTFTPGNYGLTYGDVITVVAVGGAAARQSQAVQVASALC